MIQVLGLRPWIDKDGKTKKRETFFNKGWRFDTIQDVFNPDNLAELIQSVPAHERWNLYFTVADCYEEDGRKLKEQWAIPFDIDDLDLSGDDPIAMARQAAQAGADALKVPLEEMAVAFSGNGVQFFILLDKPIVDENFFDQARVQYGVLCKRISNTLVERNIKGTVDVSVWSKARLMRLPGTINRKPERPERTATVINHTMVARPFDLYVESGVMQVDEPDSVSDVVLKNYPKPDTKAIVAGCKFLQFCKANPNDVSEPQYYAMTSITARLDDGRNLTHEYASGYHSYSHYETENKIDQALAASGPRTCKSIDQMWDGCSSCEYSGKITSPIMIKGEDYIASKDFGFRERKIKDGKVIPGRVLHMDLIRQYNEENVYKVIKDNDQVVKFNGKYWEYVTDRELKGWCASRTKPEPTAAEMAEFIAQLKSYKITSLEELNNRKEGYMNFHNCVLNVRTLETHTHSPEYGFFDVRPYSYDATATAPRFEKFLLEIMDNDADKAEILKEFGGYCVSGDPCWLQKALLLVGDGANGKSVFMEILGEVVGKDSHAAVPMQELEKDTMRHYLVNKLFNYSEETSMKALSDSSTFKAMVVGGMMSVKQLYVQPYLIANRAKIILSANNMPYSTDRSDGLLRRLVVLHFNVKFVAGTEGHDYYIKDKLRAELPGICNTLISAYKRMQRVGMLSGQVKIQDALRSYMEESDPTIMFLEQHISDGEPEDLVKVTEVYETFRQMCDMYGLKELTIIQFGRLVAKHKGLKSESLRRNGISSRYFKGIKLQKGF